MTDKNPYENDSTIDIPDFVEDTNSSDLDMSIFKMSDEELYDDVDKKQNTEESSKAPKESDKTSLIICLIIIGLLLATSCASIFYALNQKKATEQWKEKYYTISTKLPEENKNNNTSANNGNNNTEINENVNKPEENKGTVYVIKDGPISFRSSPERDTTPSNIITYNGKDSAQNGEEYTILETVTNKDSDGDSYTWGKIADKVYLCLAHGSDNWAEKKN